MKLRDYQQAAVQSIYKYYENGNKGNPLIRAPTGTGKSLIIAGFIKQTLQMYPTQRILMVTHVKELIEQNADKLKRAWPEAPMGIYSAGMGKKEHIFPITFCGIQSVAKKAYLFGHVDVMIIDECHLLSPSSESNYRKFISDLKKYNPDLIVIGLTATPFRTGQGLIYGEKESLFDKVCFDLGTVDCFNWFIEQGYLVPVIPKETTTTLDVSNVAKTAGEFNLGQLQAEVNKDTITFAALTEAINDCQDRQSWLIFCAGVEHAEDVSHMLNEMGVSCAAVHGNMTAKERQNVLDKFKRGEIRAVANNNILTTGFDHPALDFILMLRPTMSTGLFVQMLGRGTRPFYAEGFDLSTQEGRLLAIQHSPKQNCLVYDYADNSYRHGPINDPFIRKKGTKGGVAPVRTCDQCRTINHASARNCIYCGMEFTFETKLKQAASTTELIKSDLPVFGVFQVDAMSCSLNVGRGKPNTMKVSYSCGLRRFNSYICFEHDAGIAQRIAHSWWRERSTRPIPRTVAEALEVAHELLKPTHIRVHLANGEKGLKFPEIKAYCFDGSAFGAEDKKEMHIGIEVIAPNAYQKLELAEQKKETDTIVEDDIPF